MFPNSNFKITFQHVAKSLKFSMGYDRSACKFIVGIESILEAFWIIVIHKREMKLVSNQMLTEQKWLIRYFSYMMTA